MLERWDRRNQQVLEDHNGRPAPTRRDVLGFLLVFVVANVIFRVTVAVIEGWLGWAVAAGAALAAGALVASTLTRRGHLGSFQAAPREKRAGPMDGPNRGG
jgi:hypothetical protein